MTCYILDASIVVGFILGKEGIKSTTISKLLKDSRIGKVKLYSTVFLPFEVGNALRYSLPNAEIATETLKIFSNLPIELFDLTPSHYEEIMEMSYQTGTTFYDSAYHFLAKLINGIFLTADSQYFERAKELGSIQLI